MWLPSPTAPQHPSPAFTPMASLPIPTPMASSLRRLTSLANAIANGAFKAMLMLRLQAQHGSWLLSFAPLYLGMWVQSVLHYRKPPDAHGKRPGSNPNQRPGSPSTLTPSLPRPRPPGKRPGAPISMTAVLAIVISFKLAGIFDGESSWASVLWPLWALGGFVRAAG